MTITTINIFLFYVLQIPEKGVSSV